MQKTHFSVEINASKETVWNNMLGAETYKLWTAPFNAAGSWFEGDWSKGSEIRFIGPDPEDATRTGGMLAIVEENRPYEFVSLRHEAEIRNGEIFKDETATWVGAHENYTLSEKDGVTTVGVDIDLVEDFQMFMEDAWPKALQMLKEISEKGK